MEWDDFQLSDGCKLAFQTSLPISSRKITEQAKTLILLIHGFSGSSEYFEHNFEDLSSRAWTVAVDLRGHGRSSKTKGGYHVARLAADIKELVSYLKTHSGTPVPFNIIPIGCSIGAAILWTYVELFTCQDFSAMIFVDQAPLQDRSQFDNWNVTKAHRGCFDESSMLAAQKDWIETPEDAFKGLVADCLGYRFAPQAGEDLSEQRILADEMFFTSVSRECDTVWLARLLADHTRYDHREACEMITVPVLVMAGRRTGCFTLDGIKETVRRVQKGHLDRGQPTFQDAVLWSEFQSGHWLFWEEPERFNKEVAAFISNWAGFSCRKT